MDNQENGSQTEEKKRPLFASTRVKKVNNWTKDEDKVLLKKAKEYNYKNWKEVASFLPGRSDIQCSARYKRIRPGIVKGTWTVEEDENLMNLLKTFGKNWSLISKYMPSRSGKQIRDRFLNTLDPCINRDKFTKEEDMKIIQAFLKNGPAWSKISKTFDGRTGDMIKNRFYSSLKRKINKKEIVIENGIVVDMACDSQDEEGDVKEAKKESKKEPLRVRKTKSSESEGLLGHKKIRPRITKNVKIVKTEEDVNDGIKKEGDSTKMSETKPPIVQKGLSVFNPSNNFSEFNNNKLYNVTDPNAMDEQINHLIGNIVEHNIRNVLKREELEYQLQVLTQLLNLTYDKLEQNKRTTANDFEENFITGIENTNLLQPYYNMVNSVNYGAMPAYGSFLMNSLTTGVNGFNNSIISAMNNNFSLNFRQNQEDKRK
jgi:hypothetical protein